MSISLSNIRKNHYSNMNVPSKKSNWIFQWSIRTITKKSGKCLTKSFLPAKRSLFFCLFSGASGIGSPDSRPSTRTCGDLFHFETDGKKENKQKLIVSSIDILIKDVLMFFLHLNVRCCSSMGCCGFSAAASVFSNHLRAWERLGLKLSSLCVEFGETRFHYWTIGSPLGYLQHFWKWMGVSWWVEWTIPFFVAEVCAICLGGINESQVVSPGYPWRVGSFEATSKVGNARLTGRTWSHDLRVVSWSLLVGMLSFAGSERDLSCCIETSMYILYIQCFALWLDLKFTFSLDFRDVSIPIFCLL